MHELSRRRASATFLGSPLPVLGLAGLLLLLGAVGGCGSKESAAGDEGQVGVRNESAAQTQTATEADGYAEPAPSTEEAAPAVGDAPATSVDEGAPAAGSDQLEGESTTPSPDAAQPQEGAESTDSKESRSGSGT